MSSNRKQDLRVVLLGNMGSGKSAAGNTLLGTPVFVSRHSKSPVIRQCVDQSKTLEGRGIMVVDTPGLTTKVDLDMVKNMCLQLSAPGPHIFLLVIPLGGRFTKENKEAMERAVEMFGMKLYRFSIILFTFNDMKECNTIEEYIIIAGSELQQLVKKCAGRYHTFNNNFRRENDQVKKLLTKMDKLVETNGGRYYTLELEDMATAADDSSRINRFNRSTQAEVQLMESRVSLRDTELAAGDTVCMEEADTGAEAGATAPAPSQCMDPTKLKILSDTKEVEPLIKREKRQTQGEQDVQLPSTPEQQPEVQPAPAPTTVPVPSPAPASSVVDLDLMESRVSLRDTELAAGDAVCMEEADTGAEAVATASAPSQCMDPTKLKILSDTKEVEPLIKREERQTQGEQDVQLPSTPEQQPEVQPAPAPTTVPVPSPAPAFSVVDLDGDKNKKTENLKNSEVSSINIPDLISRLNLNNFYPHKLTTKEILSINMTSILRNESEKESMKEENLAFVYLHKLLTLDYRVRYVTVHNEVTICKENTTPGEYYFWSDVDDCSDINNDGNTHIHPMDVQMAVFHCADSFLKQYIVTKLSSCQYALPLLVPNPTSAESELPLWTFRQVRKTWKTADGPSRTVPVCQVRAPMVFFYRLGSVSTSKSQLVNSVINPSHDTFFHRDSPGSSRTSLFKEGLVEIAWYCPSGKSDDLFSDITAFCNLHGNAVEHREQTEFLTQQSAVNVVLMQNMNLSEKNRELLLELQKSPKPFICVVSDLQNGVKMGSGNNIKIGVRDTRQAELQQNLRHVIELCLKNSTGHIFSLKEISQAAKQCGFRVDEDREDCQKGKTGALEVMNLLKGEDLCQMKTKFLPCQGTLWHEWTKKNKQLYRFHEIVEKNKSRTKEEMRKIRKQQRNSSFNNFIKAVYKNLNSEPMVKVYFVKWLGVNLDTIFSEKLSEVTQKYSSLLSIVHSIRRKHDRDESLLKDTMEDLVRLSENVDALTLGLEHIVREMGQIYEAWAECPTEMRAEIWALPALAADLLISGHPLELMDGDAAHVPLTWIESVLDKVTGKLGDKRVFVLSVLGLQSSGKSTMLNTMFGAQFAVSAGRCTKGAFMQLVRVKEEVKDELKFDYIILLDTEGLQSLELVSKHSDRSHDNELATFITGLADLTLINIFGESLAEMKDIIQVVVQAFLRMKKVNLTPSCKFVHQNVTDISAAEKNVEARRRLQELLDNMTELAAKEERCNAECFTDVITFDIEKDVYYMPQLWEGNPPMAPPNPRYSENIESLKHAILTAAAPKKPLRFSELKVRIKDLWDAVVNEKFVFSFKNTLEIAAYRKLETGYWNWTWALRKDMLIIQNKLQNRIENGALKSVDRELIHEEIESTYCTVKKEMEKFFTEDKDAVIFSQWKTRTEININDVLDRLTQTTERKMNELIKLKAACKKLDDRKIHYENELFNRSKDLATELKNKTEKLDLQQEFNKMWNEWISVLTAEVPQVKDVNIEQEVMRLLTSSYEPGVVNSRKNSGDYRQICRGRKEDFSEYVTVKKTVKGFWNYIWNPKHHDSVRDLVQQTVRNVNEIIRSKPVSRTGYSDAYTQEIVDCVKKRVSEFKAEGFLLKNEFTVDLSLFVCETAVREFTKLHRLFTEANDPVIYLENKKEEFFSVFRKLYGGASATTVFADSVCNKLKSSILQAAYDQTAIDAAAELKANYPAFSGNRSNLEKHILQDLAETEDFQQFITYIRDPEEHFSDYMDKKIREEMFSEENPRILQILKNAVEMKEKSVDTAIQKATQETKEKKGDVNEWLKSFEKELTEKMTFTVKDHIATNPEENMDTEFFGKLITGGLQTIVNDLTNDCNILDLDMFQESLENILMDHLCGCWVQCPFCAAICTNTMENHDGDHSVPFHRPEGVDGSKWYNTENLCIEFCTSSVASDCSIVLSEKKSVPYKKYREAGPEYACWSITPDESTQAYWKWFVCKFQKDLESYYGGTFQGEGDIPKDWRGITKEEAIKSLN